MQDQDEPPLPWREAARQVMYEATLREAEQRYGSRNPVYNYRWEHVSAVCTLAMRLARLTGADLEVIEAAAWLHDGERSGSRPSRLGAVFARSFCQRRTFPGEDRKGRAHD